jgi:hypothetical protein
VYPRLLKVIRRDGREAEGAPLLREYRANNSIEGSNPSLSAIYRAYKWCDCLECVAGICCYLSWGGVGAGAYLLGYISADVLKINVRNVRYCVIV